MKSALKIVCAAVIALALSIQAFASFSDVPENAWYAQPVEMLSEMGTIDGYGDGTFGPDDTLEAAQLLKILGMTFYPEEIAPQGEDESWGARFYAAALDHGVVTEELVSADEMYDKISRYKVAAIISAVMINIMGEDIAVPDEVSARIGDFDEIPEEYAAAVKTVYSAGVIGGCDEKGSYKGDLELTRAQAATIVMRMLRAARPHSARRRVVCKYDVPRRLADVRPRRLQRSQDPDVFLLRRLRLLEYSF